MTSAVIERDLEVAQTLRTDTETTALGRLLDDVYAYAQNANLLREDVSAHGKLETAANARGLVGDAQKIIHALIAILTVLALIIGFGLIFTSRLIFKPRLYSNKDTKSPTGFGHHHQIPTDCIASW